MVAQLCSEVTALGLALNAHSISLGGHDSSGEREGRLTEAKLLLEVTQLVCADWFWLRHTGFLPPRHGAGYSLPLDKE